MFGLWGDTYFFSHPTILKYRPTFPVLWIRNHLFRCRIRIQLQIVRVPDPDSDPSNFILGGHRFGNYEEKNTLNSMEKKNHTACMQSFRT